MDKTKRDEENSTRNVIKQAENALISNSISKQLKDDIKKIIMKPKTLRIENPSATTGRFKKVQFNTLPEFSTHQEVLFCPEFDKEFSLNADSTEDCNTNNFEESLPLYRNDGDVNIEKSKNSIYL